MTKKYNAKEKSILKVLISNQKVSNQMILTHSKHEPKIDRKNYGQSLCLSVLVVDRIAMLITPLM